VPQITKLGGPSLRCEAATDSSQVIILLNKSHISIQFRCGGGEMGAEVVVKGNHPLVGPDYATGAFKMYSRIQILTI
jgi:hypothetical protein